jgi:hypothetical protein
MMRIPSLVLLAAAHLPLLSACGERDEPVVDVREAEPRAGAGVEPAVEATRDAAARAGEVAKEVAREVEEQVRDTPRSDRDTLP